MSRASLMLQTIATVMFPFLFLFQYFYLLFENSIQYISIMFVPLPQLLLNPHLAPYPNSWYFRFCLCLTLSQKQTSKQQQTTTDSSLQWLTNLWQGAYVWYTQCHPNDVF